MAPNDENEIIIMKRQCMFCGDPIAEWVEYPRELCPKDACSDKWNISETEEHKKLRENIDAEYEKDRSVFDFPSQDE